MKIRSVSIWTELEYSSMSNWSFESFLIDLNGLYNTKSFSPLGDESSSISSNSSPVSFSANSNGFASVAEDKMNLGSEP